MRDRLIEHILPARFRLQERVQVALVVDDLELEARRLTDDLLDLLEGLLLDQTFERLDDPLITRSRRALGHAGSLSNSRTRKMPDQAARAR